MNRSAFLQKLITSFVVGKLPISLTKDFRKIYLLQCFVAGFRHYEGINLLGSMKEGHLLELKREPTNEYDACAIALYFQGKKIGFIPASINEMLSYLLDAEALSLFAVITHLEHYSQPWENVAVAVYFVQEVNKNLPAHASYLTRIEAPHYKTLHNNGKKIVVKKQYSLDDLLDATDRVINVDALPGDRHEVKKKLEDTYGNYQVQINGKGKYLHIKDDGIYSYLYDINDTINEVTDANGKKFLEFFLE